MSRETSRPVYTKSRLTKERDRFHGAFKGGFSAGHFNTVGSSKGWNPEQNNPSETSKRMKRPFSKILLDYMDEEDANEWGGPSGLKQNFKSDDANVDNYDSSSSNHMIDENFDLKLLQSKGYHSIGKSLLRVLGWREKEGGQIVYAPMDEENDSAFDAPISKLTNKRLKKIQLKLNQQIQRKLPSPKLGTHGLGYDPYKDAPEFQRHREMRMKQAQMRALAATSQDGKHRKDVYRTSDIDDPHSNQDHNVDTMRHSRPDLKANVLAYETADDFIGTKTVAGFALHDDDDDVYDEAPSGALEKRSNRGITIDESEFNTEIFHSSDSDDNEKDQNESQNIPFKGGTRIDVLQDAFRSWASNDNNVRKADDLANDGSRILEGFVLGRNSSTPTNRWPGPLVPIDYKVQRHVFTPDNCSESMRIKSDLIKKRKITHGENSHHLDRQTPNISMARSHFSSLADTLKNRFVTHSTNVSRHPTSEEAVKKSSSKTLTTISRTWTNWKPSHLLCKRMNVRVPHSSQASTATMLGKDVETREETFFREEILGKLGPRHTNDTFSEPIPSALHVDEMIDYERPTIEYMKSIFGTSADSDMSISDDETANRDDSEKSVSNVTKKLDSRIEERPHDEDYVDRKRKKRKKKHKHESKEYKKKIH